MADDVKTLMFFKIDRSLSVSEDQQMFFELQSSTENDILDFREFSQNSVVEETEKVYKCEHCDKTYNQNRSLKHHHVTKHPSIQFCGKSVHAEKKVFKCEHCDKTFKQNRSLKHHYATQHPSAVLCRRRNVSQSFDCKICHSKFTNKKALSFHKKNVHFVVTQKQKCPLCEIKLCKKGLINHYEALHHIVIEKEEHGFTSLDHFMEWKAAVEADTNAHYVKENGTKSFRNASWMYYTCHRSGMYKSGGVGKRNLKKQGSCKINGYCPSSLTVSYNSESIKVQYVKTHVGHLQDLEHLTLTLSEREAIALKLSSKVPFDAVLNDVRKGIMDGKLKRLHLLTHKDLHNIQQSFRNKHIRQLNNDNSFESRVNEEENISFQNISFDSYVNKEENAAYQHISFESYFNGKENAIFQEIETACATPLEIQLESLRKQMNVLLDLIQNEEDSEIVRKCIESAKTAIEASHS